VLPFSHIALLAFDIDGTLTDATTWWAGEAVGWVQRYSVRDGEALLRIKQRIPVLPLSRNKTQAARIRMEGLGLDTRWLGVHDKVAALGELCEAYAIEPERVAVVGDGPDDAVIFSRVGLGCAVSDAHRSALASAHVILRAPGGGRVIEEIENRMEGHG